MAPLHRPGKYKQLAEYLNQGHNNERAAAKANVSTKVARNLADRLARGGPIVPDCGLGSRPVRTPEMLAALQEIVEAQQTLYLSEMVTLLALKGFPASWSTVQRALQDLELSYKVVYNR
jgi:transposase